MTPQELIARLRAFLRGRALDREFEQELDAHLDLLTQDHIRRGLAPDAARRAALIRLGGVEAAKERHRDARGLPALESILQDLRHALRTLRRDAGFTIFALLIVGLGIGASVTVFSVVQALLLRPLPFHAPDRLVWMGNTGDDGVSEWRVQVGHFLDLREQSRAVADLAGYYAFHEVKDSKVTSHGEPERVSSLLVTRNFFTLLGVEPQMGRGFTEEECIGPWGAPKAALLSDALWRRRFGADPAIVGRVLSLNDAPATIVGVLPPTFDFATVFAPGSRVDLFVPLPLTEQAHRRGNTLSVIGRLADGASVASAQAELVGLAKRLENQHPDRNSLRPRLTSLGQRVSGQLRLALIVLACAVGLVMLIVCANLSNLQLARAASRQKELAIRVALGAGRRRLVRQLLTESVVLSCGGALLGLALAVSGTRVLSRLEAVSLPMLGSVRVDAAALGFTVLIALLAGLIFGALPALHVPAGAVHDALKESVRGSSDGPRHARIRGALVVAEVALACVLLVGAGLLARSFLRVLDVDLGFRPERAAALRIDPSRAQYVSQAQRNAYFDEALRRVEEIPGISAGLTDVLPLGGNRSWGVAGQGQVYARGQYPEAFVRIISDGYFTAMGIALRAGRDFTAQDREGSERVLIINETLARTLWPGQDPIGRMVTQDDGRRVVGVVSDVRHRALEETAGGEMYLPIRQTNDYAAVDLIVRTELPPERLASAIRAALAPLDPSLPANEFRPLQALVDKAVSPRRFVVWLLGAFSAFALVLASLGIYGVISYSVSQRTQEIGIRMALGASARDVQARVVRQTLGLAGLGLAIGVAASWLLGRTMSGLLFGVTATDPVTFAGMIAVLTTVATLAGYLPARRASRIDPTVALRAN